MLLMRFDASRAIWCRLGVKLTVNVEETNQGCLEALAGRQLTAVAFVLDYLRLEFEVVFLTVLSDPYVEAAGVSVGAGTVGYRDSLCEHVAQTVTEAKEEKGKEIRVGFADGSVITIPLENSDRRGAEAARLQIPNEGMCVWHFD